MLELSSFDSILLGSALAQSVPSKASLSSTWDFSAMFLHFIEFAAHMYKSGPVPLLRLISINLSLFVNGLPVLQAGIKYALVSVMTLPSGVCSVNR